ncbi:MFS transporter [Burkholderia pseudomultivorans]|uniref:MFS transporter n=1 Tax=Burkholderia pseudomultivorans TaxID=1207504 RepID=UPI00075F5888|nr:MFS transporter [Burkholderia pseudomultivorans]AOI89278.1 MFS transporter [Burkholderia pseudomultivorans]KVC48923.1 MFS transporter [Burkholderia pseudomultivorans]
MQNSALTPAVAADPPTATDTISTRKIIAATTLGNGLEVFDFTVYSFFAAYIGSAFFPSHDPLTSLLLSVGTFGAGFFARPLGALLIGSYADRVGRRAAMTLTIWLMTLGTAAIGLCPTYARIGVAAPLVVLAGRLLQGFSAGGEIGASTTLLMESGEVRKRGYMVSWQTLSQGVCAMLGALFGLTLSHVLTPDALVSWGWRLPFLIGLLIAPVGYYIRRHLPEVCGVASGRDTAQPPLRELASSHLAKLVACVFLLMSSTVTMYTAVYFMPSYLTRVMHLPATTAFLAAMIGAMVMVAMSLVSGVLADSLRQRRRFALIFTAISTCVALPAFWLITHLPTPAIVLSVSALLTGLMVLGSSNLVLMMMEAFPQRVRASGFATSYAFSVTLFGGTAPFVVTALIAHAQAPFMAGVYVFVCNLVSLAAVYAYREQWRANA